MKKILAGLLSLCMISGLVIMPVSAETEGSYTYEVSDGEAEITGFDRSISGEITIPSTLGGCPVTSIGIGAFMLSSLTSISVPESVTSIGIGAFEYCTRLTSISIPDEVTSIGTRAFEDCTSLTSISIPKGVTNISMDAFCNCTSLTSIAFPESLTSIEAGAFSNCTSLTSIVFPESLISIGMFAFQGCTSLTSINVPEGASINHGAFSACTSLKNINIDENNGSYASQEGVLFNKDKTVLLCCPGGKEGYYRIPEGVTSIDEHAFLFCTGLTSISIPESVTSIGGWAFGSCTSLTSISIPESVTSIGNYAFRVCTSLTSISIPQTLTSIGDFAFEECTSLTDVYYSGTEDQWKEISIGDFNECLTNATIHYNYTFPEIILEPIADDITIDKTISKNGRITATIASESRDMSDIQMFVSTHKDGLMTNASEVAKEVSDGKVTFTTALPPSNGRIFIWDSKQRPLTKVTEIE